MGCDHNWLLGPVAGCEVCDWQWTEEMLEQAIEARHGANDEASL